MTRGEARVAGVMAALTLGVGCSCRDKTDEERLRERIDTTSVHLYVATKIALAGEDTSPAVVRARAAVLTALAASGQIVEHVGGTADAGTSSSAREALGQAGAAAGDALALTTALLELRETGAEVVRGQRPEGTVAIRGSASTSIGCS